MLNLGAHQNAPNQPPNLPDTLPYPNYPIHLAAKANAARGVKLTY